MLAVVIFLGTLILANWQPKELPGIPTAISGTKLKTNLVDGNGMTFIAKND